MALYPEFSLHASLAGLLREAATRQGIQFKVVGYDELDPPMSPYWATCGTWPRASAVTIGIEQRRFSVPLWDQGVELASCSAAEPDQVVSVLAAWQSGCSIQELEAANPETVKLKPWAAAYTKGPAAYAEFKWAEVMAASDISPQIRAFAKLAAGNRRLAALVPVLARMLPKGLRFSETCGSPYATAEVWLESAAASLTLHNGKEIAPGLNAVDALRAVETRLPESFGPARYGAADA
jgi:hypothetical protein